MAVYLIFFRFIFQLRIVFSTFQIHRGKRANELGSEKKNWNIDCVWKIVWWISIHISIVSYGSFFHCVFFVAFFGWFIMWRLSLTAADYNENYSHAHTRTHAHKHSSVRVCLCPFLTFCRSIFAFLWMCFGVLCVCVSVCVFVYAFAVFKPHFFSLNFILPNQNQNTCIFRYTHIDSDISEWAVCSF